MQPVNSPRSSLVYSLTNKFAPNSLTLSARVNGGVQQKTVNATIPGYFDESDQFI